MRDAWKGIFVVKGILHPQDAEEALRVGADGLIVSNHGGRQLATAAAPFAVLPTVVDAVGSRLAVMVDGGVRRGSDIVRAVLAGACFVFAGRPTLYGAAAGGEPGAARALTILLDEFDRTMALLGCRTFDELRANVDVKSRERARLISAATQ